MIVKLTLRFTFVASVLLPAMATHAAPVRLLVPAYQYPTLGNLWSGLTAAARKVPVTLILNPNTGPGNARDDVYVAALDQFIAAGGQVLAYVNTSSPNGVNGERNAGEVLNDITRYQEFYPGRFSGIFFDLIATDLAHLAYHRAIYDAVKAIDPLLFIMGNPGTSIAEAYLAQNAVDAVMNFENFASEFERNPPDSWVYEYPATRFAHIVHTQPNAGDVAGIVQTMQARNGGWAFVTDATMPNPYDRLPSYWDEELRVIAAENAPEPGALLLVMIGLGAMLRVRRKAGMGGRLATGAGFVTYL